MGKVGAYVALLLLGIVLIDVGITGRLGSLLGAVITPSSLLDSEAVAHGG
jgi:hypothetical protein